MSFVLGSSAVANNAPSPTPVSAAGVSGAIDIAAGRIHTCVVVGGGGVKCWGDNSVGQLGVPSSTTSMSASAQAVPGVTGATSVFAGFNATCAVVVGGGLKCWGQIDYRGDGNGITTDTSLFSVPALASLTSVALGLHHICAVTSGTVSCWGDNMYEECDVPFAGGPVGMSIKVPTSTGVSATAVSAGTATTCAATSEGAKCWGAPILGSGSPSLATMVSGTSDTVGVVVGEDLSRAGHICVLSSAGATKCWGDNTTSALGLDPATFSMLSAPTFPVSGLAAVTSLSAGTDHTCATAPDGTVRCWGSNAFTQIGLPLNQPMAQYTPNVIAGW